MNHGIHVKYMNRCLSLLPHQYTAQDLNHMSLANFTISSLCLLGEVHDTEIQQRQIAWIYSHLTDDERGFRGSLNATLLPYAPGARYDPAHLPATYFAISSLLTLGDDLAKLNHKKIIHELADLQMPDGSFSSTSLYQDIDIRFSYMAVAIRYILLEMNRDLILERDIDCLQALSYIASCRTFDGGFGQCPGAESHAGLTFCALAAQYLLGDKIDGVDKAQTLNFLVNRHVCEDGGFNGRIGKESDVCYCFWVTGSLTILESSDLIDEFAVRQYVQRCETPIGGYGKTVADLPDVYHTYLGLCVRRVLEKPDPLIVALCVFRTDSAVYRNV